MVYEYGLWDHGVMLFFLIDVKLCWTVGHGMLLKKMEYYGVKGNTLLWFRIQLWKIDLARSLCHGKTVK